MSWIRQTDIIFKYLMHEIELKANIRYDEG